MTTQAGQTLEPCPFCSNTDLEFLENRQSSFSERIVCRKCDAWRIDQHACRLSELSFYSKAITDWNTRAPDPLIAALTEALELSSEKLLLYYKLNNEYVGGLEHSFLQKRIADALQLARERLK